MRPTADFFADPSFRSLLRVLKIAFFISYTTHVMACFWVLVGRLSDEEDARLDDQDLSRDRSPGGGRYYWRHEDHSNWLQAEGFSYQDCTRQRYIRAIYLSAYYFCLTTMTSVGFGDILPFNENERAFVVVLEAIGGFVYAMVIASLTSVVTSMDSNQSQVGRV